MNKARKKTEQNEEQFVFQAETKELLNLMINSLYINKDIFLRELISNASDALDKLHFLSLTDHSLVQNDEELHIIIDVNKKDKTITITDNGIGMTRDEVIENIGTIAKSGTSAFMKAFTIKEVSENFELIGKFGVGFYSAFMVADKVEIYTRIANTLKGVKWESKGDGVFVIKDVELKQRGTRIVLFLKKDCYNTSDPAEDLLNEYSIQNLVEKYSNYIKYPIKMDFYREEFPKDKKGKITEDAEPETIITNKILNSITPIWKKNKIDLTNDDYFQFYKHHFHDWNEFADVIHYKVEGKVEFTALLFIPSKAFSDLYDKDYSKGIDLYCNDVFVMKNCKDVLPDHFRFIRGLVDSHDFTLNVSREILQHDAQLKLIGKNLEIKVIESLKRLLQNERKKYEEMWQDFGKAIKGGIYMEFKNKEKLQDLVLFTSSASSEGFTTLKEYVERMPEGQNEIFYAASKDIETIRRMPQLEIFREKNIETLFFTDKIDEFLVQNLDEYLGNKLVSITRENFNLRKIEKFHEIDAQEELPDELEKEPNEHRELLNSIKKHLGEKVKEVKISKRLITSPVCMVNSNSGMTFNMEQLLKGVNQPSAKAARILELNPKHKLFSILQRLFEKNQDSLEMKNCIEILYYQAMMMEGYDIDNPADFTHRISELLISAYALH